MPDLYKLLTYDGIFNMHVKYPCECGEEPSGSIKRGEFLDQLQTS